MEKPNKLRTRDFYNSIGVTSLDIYFDPKLGPILPKSMQLVYS